MKRMVDIKVVLDSQCPDPKVTIRARERNEQVVHIIEAIETVSENDYPVIPGFDEGSAVLLSQRDIIRVYTDGRKIVLQTQEHVYTTNKTLAQLEELLNPGRFVRISKSEIANLYMVRRFDFNNAGTIGITYENGDVSWVARSRVKQIKELLKKDLPY
ncbi:MAG: LytTR family transcriptional regulator [Butyrivibrio sp.]|nr:LytTR family transcriptional regulator [Butyrivibrio sp.]